MKLGLTLDHCVFVSRNLPLHLDCIIIQMQWYNSTMAWHVHIYRFYQINIQITVRYQSYSWNDDKHYRQYSSIPKLQLKWLQALQANFGQVHLRWIKKGMKAGIRHGPSWDSVGKVAIDRFVYKSAKITTIFDYHPTVWLCWQYINGGNPLLALCLKKL